MARAQMATGATTMLPTEPGAFDPGSRPTAHRWPTWSAPSCGRSSTVRTWWWPATTTRTRSWGSAEFVAGEEMGRTRGFWWSPDGSALLVARVDVTPVQEWWIAAPVTPELAPTAGRYPAAGTANAEVELWIVGLHGTRRRIDWAGDEWEYLADAFWSDDGIWLTVQSRDQRTLAVLHVDPDSGAATERHRVVDGHWVELVPGTPAVHDGRLVTVEDRGPARRLCVDGEPLTGDDVQIRRVVHVDDSGITVTASAEPTTVHVAHVDWNGRIEWLTEQPGVHSAVVGGPTRVVVSRGLEFDGARVAVHRDGTRVATLVDHAEVPPLALNLHMHRLGPRELASALLLPKDDDGAGPLPVLLDPYGGPHAQRVQVARGLFHSSQWFADQGFAVLVTDGRGTPGRGPAFEREVRGDLAGPVLDDQIAALEAAAALEPRLDLTRVAIRGWSFGGFLAALAVLRRPDVFHAAIAGAPVTDWTRYDTHYTERYLGHPDDEPDTYARSGLLTEPARFDAAGTLPPLMLIHGLADDNVVAAHTLQLSRALLEAGLPHTVLPLSGVTHMTPQEAVAENLLLLQLAFLRDALGLPPGDLTP
ncbi:MAG: prolyl oligopeptidase family serine peptidase [Acidimicrobiales bacterium]